MTRHIHADHMIAAANDTSIKWDWNFPAKVNSDWLEVAGHPSWDTGLLYRQRPAPHPHQAMMDIAEADPSIVWQKKWAIVGWKDLEISPLWDKNTEYRQKPAEPKMVDLWQWAIRYDSSSPIYAADTYYDNEFSVKNDRPGYEIVCRIEGSKISVVSQ